MKPDQTPTSWAELVAAIADQERLVGAPRQRFVASLSRCDPVQLVIQQRRKVLNLGAVLCLISGPIALTIFFWVGQFTPSTWIGAAILLGGVPGFVFINQRARNLTAKSAYSKFGEEWRQYCARLRPQLTDHFPIDPSPPRLG